MRTHLELKFRLYCIDQLIRESARKGEYVPFDRLVSELRCSPPTLKRDLRYMRETLKVPIVYSRARGGYSYPEESGQPRRGVPPVWYSPAELYMLIVAQQLFSGVEAAEGGLLQGDMKAMKARLLSMVQDDRLQARELQKRFRVLLPQHRPCRSEFFEVIGGATAARKRLRVAYYTRRRQKETVRELSPMRLTCYRNRWYLDAWCHTTEALKTFSLDNIRAAEVLPKNCRNIAMREVERQLDSTYGIYSGAVTYRAVIEVDPDMAVYVREEIWHRDQEMEVREDGSLRLSVPYAHATELIGQILKLGRHARVVEPESLRRSVREELEAVLGFYPPEDQSRGS